MIAFVFDTETTGLIDNGSLPLSKQPEIIEFYGARVDLSSGEIEKEVNSLVLPSRLPLPEKTRALTGIFESMLVGRPKFSVLLPEIRTTMSGCDVALAHNASFDEEMVEIELKRCGGRIDWPRVVCTVEQTVHLTGRRLTLAHLHELLFGEKFRDAHRAKSDAAALIRCSVELRRRKCL